MEASVSNNCQLRLEHPTATTTLNAVTTTSHTLMQQHLPTNHIIQYPCCRHHHLTYPDEAASSHQPHHTIPMLPSPPPHTPLCSSIFPLTTSYNTHVVRETFNNTRIACIIITSTTLALGNEHYRTHEITHNKLCLLVNESQVERQFLKKFIGVSKFDGFIKRC